jgi:D-beta-D-heptose 7-phosphate kinase/D-beta-D-heptose 1-phosphate adenosyltransferase
LRGLLAEAGIGCEGLVEDPNRPTVEKVRIVTDRNQQVARIDYEDDSDAAGMLQQQIVERVERLASNARVILVSDYLKGAITKDVMRSLAPPHGGPPLIVDPKIGHLDYYAGATLITPNHHEAEAATQRRIRSDEEARVAAIDFRARARCKSVLITRGDQGMWLSSDECEGAVPAIGREVADVTGAGDTVVAALALGVAAGATLAEAARLANQSAALVVAKFGPAVVTADELVAALSA